MLENKLENVVSQMRKGSLEFAILLLIQSKKQMYTSEIITELQKIELIVVEGTLYPLLNRLLKEDLLSYSWAESASGPPRKYYQITNLGTQLINKLIPAWQSYTTSINSLIPKLWKSQKFH